MSDSFQKRNLPSWMSAREEEDLGIQDHHHHPEPNSSTSSQSNHAVAQHLAKLMDGVVFVLSGFVNPERAQLRSRAFEMGAQFQTDWNPNCTLLICAFPNTPKFHQVEADSGTIVSKEWISECYNQRKLVDIEPYLLHAGKPWRRRPQSVSPGPKQEHKASSSQEFQIDVEKSLNSRPSYCASSKGKPTDQVGDSFSPSVVKKWATDDFSKTLSWLESQDEKPGHCEIKKIATEGILTCLQDIIDTLEQRQDIQQISEQWACIPRVVEELIKFDSGKGDSTSVSKEDLRRHAVACKQIYEAEYQNISDDSSTLKRAEKRMETSGKRGKGRENEERVVDKEDDDMNGAYDSDETVEMTEDEIDRAYNIVASSMVDFER